MAPFSSPFLRGGYRSSGRVLSISVTLKVLVPFSSGWLSISQYKDNTFYAYIVLVPFSSGWLSIKNVGGVITNDFSSRPLFFGVVIDRTVLQKKRFIVICSRPLFFGVVIDRVIMKLQCYLVALFSSPFLRGGYRS